MASFYVVVPTSHHRSVLTQLFLFLISQDRQTSYQVWRPEGRSDRQTLTRQKVVRPAWLGDGCVLTSPHLTVLTVQERSGPLRADCKAAHGGHQDKAIKGKSRISTVQISLSATTSWFLQNKKEVPRLPTPASMNQIQFSSPSYEKSMVSYFF